MYLSIVLEPAGHYRREWLLKSIISSQLFRGFAPATVNQMR